MRDFDDWEAAEERDVEKKREKQEFNSGRMKSNRGKRQKNLGVSLYHRVSSLI